ncbi:MAG: TRAP transporter small permease [Bosea sp. (in: a-proteobacteria)]
MLFGSIDTIGTQLFGKAIPSSHEFQEAFEAVLIFCALAAVQNRKAHIVIDLITGSLQGGWRRASDIFALTVTAGFFMLLTTQAFRLAMRSIGAGELSPGYISFPLYVFKILFFVGCLIALLETVRQLAHAVFGRQHVSEETITTTHF